MEAFGERIQSGVGRARAKIREAQIQMNTEVLVSDPTKKKSVRCSLEWGVGTGRAHITLQRWPSRLLPADQILPDPKICPCNLEDCRSFLFSALIGNTCAFFPAPISPRIVEPPPAIDRIRQWPSPLLPSLHPLQCLSQGEDSRPKLGPPKVFWNILKARA